jgi:outer membrane protein assembly factor BamA
MLMAVSFISIILVALPNDIDVTISGSIYFSESYLMRNHPVREFNDVELLIEDILDTYTSAGFPFCEVRPIVERIGDSLTNIVLRVQEGARITIAGHLFLPDKHTVPGVIRRYVHPENNLYFSSKEIARIKQRLLRTGAFMSVTENIVYRNDLYYLLWTLNEQQTDFISAFGTVSEDDYIFSISLHSINLLGTLRRLEFLYEYEKLFTVKFTEPILLAPTAIRGDFSLWSYDTMQLLEAQGIITTPLNAIFDVSILTGIERASYADTLTTAHTHTVLGSGLAAHAARAWLIVDQSFMVDYLIRDIDRWRLHYDGSITLFDMHVRSHGRYVFTDSLEFFDHFRLGGAQSLRGYYEEEFTVDQAFWVNIEYKRIFLFPLVDIGYLDKNFFYSYGFGITAQSRFAHAELILAWPKDGSWRDGMLHLTFEKGF